MGKVEGKVENLVERARHLSLHPHKEAQRIHTFHASIDEHLKKIYESVSASPAAKEDLIKIINQDRSSDGSADGDPLASLDVFRAYMKDPASSAQAPPEELDLSAPISDYYISSSHNTYLTGNQLYSDAAASAYSSVLLRGCRSVEIDVWDGEADKSDSSDDEDTSDSSDEEGGLGSKLKKKITSKSSDRENPEKEKFDKGLKHSLSSKLGDKLHRSSSKSTEPIPGEDPATSHLPKRVEPRVLHGHTLTKGTTFREICYAIRDYAFVTSDLPLIISFEVHASLEQQQIMVDIVKEAWKGLLVEVPPDVEADKLPTLAELKNKILIKTKSTPLPNSDQASDQLEKSVSPEESNDAAGEKAKKPAKPAKILEALAKLAVYTRAYHFNRFDQPEAKVPVHIFSLSEKAAREAHTTHRDALFEHNRLAMMRIYPFAFRVTSSNFDPSFYWRRGAQLVALNWQNLDKGMMLDHGMFVGTPGWELKPLGYRSQASPSNVIRLETLDLTIQVFAAQNLSLPEDDHSERWFRPYVVCQLHVEEPEDPAAADHDDASTESEKSSYRRCTKSSSGCNPDFNGEKLAFPTVAGIMEELSFVRFKIKDDEIGPDSLAAWACIRLDRLREGYRLVHLHNDTGESSGGALLVHISKRAS